MTEGSPTGSSESFLVEREGRCSPVLKRGTPGHMKKPAWAGF